VSDEDKNEMDAANSDWMFERAQDRAEKRDSKLKSDWLFERARERSQKRKIEQQSDWLFERARDREEQRQQDEESLLSGNREGKAKKREKPRFAEDGGSPFLRRGRKPSEDSANGGPPYGSGWRSKQRQTRRSWIHAMKEFVSSF